MAGKRLPRHAAHTLGVQTVTACTLASNAPMLAFFARRGLPQTGAHIDEGSIEWLVFSAPIADLQLSHQPAPPLTFTSS